MTNLYTRNGEHPRSLRDIEYDAENHAYTQPYTDEVIAHLGFTLAPPVPEHDPAAQRVEWQDGGWVLIDLPPAPEPEPLPPVSLTVGDLVGRFRIPEENAAFDALDDAMMAEPRLVRRNWQIDTYRFTEGDGFWTVIAGHLDAIVSADRKAELLAG